jgi:23S rRNA pseudoU1915 N3-methylase RlmH
MIPLVNALQILQDKGKVTKDTLLSIDKNSSKVKIPNYGEQLKMQPSQKLQIIQEESKEHSDKNKKIVAKQNQMMQNKTQASQQMIPIVGKQGQTQSKSKLSDQMNQGKPQSQLNTVIMYNGAEDKKDNHIVRQNARDTYLALPGIGTDERKLVTKARDDSEKRVKNKQWGKN